MREGGTDHLPKGGPLSTVLERQAEERGMLRWSKEKHGRINSHQDSDEKSSLWSLHATQMAIPEGAPGVGWYGKAAERCESSTKAPLETAVLISRQLSGDRGVPTNPEMQTQLTQHQPGCQKCQPDCPPGTCTLTHSQGVAMSRQGSECQPATTGPWACFLLGPQVPCV